MSSIKKLQIKWRRSGRRDKNLNIKINDILYRKSWLNHNRDGCYCSLLKIEVLKINVF